MRARGSDQVANHPDAALGRPEAESKLVGRSHCREFTGAELCRKMQAHTVLARARSTAISASIDGHDTFAGSAPSPDKCVTEGNRLQVSELQHHAQTAD